MKLKDYSFFIIVLFSSINFFAQSLKIEVVDVDTSAPIAGVEVYTKAGKLLGTTNNLGKLTVLSSSKSKIQQLILFEFSYKTYKIEVNVNNSQNYLVKMVPLGEVLSEVVLKSKKKEIFGLTTLKPVEGIHIFAGKKSEVIVLDLEVANKATNNARQIFAKVAGLNIYESGDGGLQLSVGGRGLDPNRTANFNTRQNDYDISADVLGYPESYYTPPSEALEKVQIVRGAASLQYGTQFGGLINFIFKKPSYKPIEVVTRNTLASFGTYTNFTSVSGTKDNFKYNVFYNGKKGDGFRPNSNYKSNNVFAFASYDFNDKTSISAEYTHFYYLAKQAGGLSDAQFLSDPFQSYRSRNWFTVNWNLFNLKLNHQFSENVSGILSVFALDASRKALGFRTNPLDPNANIFDVTSDEVDEFGNFDFPRDLILGDFRNYGAEARVISNYTIKNQLAVLLLGAKFYKANNTSQQGAGSFGTDADFTLLDADFLLENTTPYPNQNTFTYPNLNLSFFGENIFNITDNLSITPGFRFEYIKTESKGGFLNAANNQGNNINTELTPDNNTRERSFVLLGVGLSYKPKPYFESYFNFSQNYRSVTFSDIRTVNPSFAVDPNIQDESGYTIDFGVRGIFKKAVSYDVNAFSLLYNNRIGQFFSNEPPFRAQWVRGNLGTANIFGLESLVQWNLQETFFKENENVKFEVFSNLSLITSKYTSDKQQSISGNKVEFIPEINLKTGVSFGYKDFLTSLQFTYLSEQFTDATNSAYNPDNFNRVDGAIPAYHILDLSTSYRFSKYIKLEAGINNLTDNIYFTRRATGYPGPGIIPSATRNWYTTLQIII